MALTIREQLIVKFVARAQTLTVIPVKRVERSQAESQEKFISVWDGEDQQVDMKFGKELNQFPIMLISEWDTGDVNASEAVNAYMGEVIAAVLGPNHDLDGLADSIEKVTMAPTYPNDGSNIAVLQAGFLIKYKTVRGNPYTQ